MSQIFDAKTREKIVSVHITCGFNPEQTRAYIESLESVAKAAAAFWQQCGNDDALIPFDQIPPAEQKLMKALDTVDWMRNE